MAEEGYFDLTKLHRDDVISQFEVIDRPIDPETLTDEVMTEIAERMVSAWLDDLYWTSLVIAYDEIMAEKGIENGSHPPHGDL